MGSVSSFFVYSLQEVTWPMKVGTGSENLGLGSGSAAIGP